MRKIINFFIVATTCLMATAAFASPQAPHNFDNGIGCADCHAPYGGLNAIAVSEGAADVTSTDLTLVDLTKEWSANQWVGGIITITSGDNLGQFRVIKSNTEAVITWDGALAVALAEGDTYKIGLTTEADIETKCKSCHNPAGQAAGMDDVGQHMGDQGAVGCGKCHDPHNTVPNSGLGAGLIRASLSFNKGTPVTYPAEGDNPYITGDPANPGLCEACHTKTAYYRADGAGADHMTWSSSCSTASCHGHGEGFGTAAYGGGHMDPEGAAWTYGNGGGTSCARCHTAGGAQWYQAEFVANGQIAVTENPSSSYAIGPLTCDSCHNATADALVNIPFMASDLVVAAVDQPTALCSQCHQGREAMASVNSAVLGADYSGTATALSPSELTDSTQTFALDLTGAKIIFTNGSLIGSVVTITGYTDTTATFEPAFGSYGFPTVMPTYRIVGTSAAGNADDVVIASLGFKNVHYLPASGVLMGGGPAALGMGTQVGYEYAPVADESAARFYAPMNAHVASMDGCTECHNKHTGEILIESCGECHSNEAGQPVATVEELAESRIFGWEEVDIDGDGVEEGIKAEISGLGVTLYAAIQAYATNVSLQDLCYDSHAYPYFFKDLDGSGDCDPSEANYGGQYKGFFTARLVRAAFNYQVYKKEPGAWAHNPMYIIGLLVDSIDDLNFALDGVGQAVAFAGTRTRAGHFDQDSGAFRHWDHEDDNRVSSSCAPCHGGSEGLDNYLADPLTALTSTPVPGMQCTTCHETAANGDPDLETARAVASVRFPPSGDTPTVVSMPVDTDNLCATCHSGRQTGATVEAGLVGVLDTEWTVRFSNYHYLGLAGVQLGADAGAGLEFAGKTYAGAELHHGQDMSCVYCHDPVATKHTFDVAANVDACDGCHGSTDFLTYKSSSHADNDYDGDGTVNDLHVELDGLTALVLAELVDYGAGLGYTISYTSHYPYFGVAESGNKFNPPAARAAYNYNFLLKSTGAWAHNFDYAAQIAIDTIESLGGDVSGLIRP